jgi:hypothetical protein
MEFESSAKFVDWMREQKGRDFPKANGVVFQRTLDVGSAAVNSGWYDIAVRGEADGGAMITLYRPVYGRDPLEVEVKIDASGGGTVLATRQALTAAWDKPIMDNVAQVLPDFLKKIEELATKQ